MDIADGKLGHVTGTTHIVAQSLRGEGVVSLAKSILLQLGPYNGVVCRNCHKQQELVGRSCYSCGYRLRVDVSDAADRGRKHGRRAATRRSAWRTSRNRTQSKTITSLPSRYRQNTRRLGALIASRDDSSQADVRYQRGSGSAPMLSWRPEHLDFA